MKLKQLAFSLMAIACGVTATAVPVKVTMNNVSPTMSLTVKDSNTKVETGEPENKIYTFDAPAGEYVLTVYATDGATVNGTIVINVTDAAEEQSFDVLTNTAGVTNKHDDNTIWTIENGDYTIDVSISSREGELQLITLGKSLTENRYTFLALSGHTYNVKFIPSEEHQKEDYTILRKSGTLTYNVNLIGEIPKCMDYSIRVPADAELFIGIKEAHFIDFTAVEPKSVETMGDVKIYTYTFSDQQYYNYRTWMDGGLTQAGYFTMSIDETKRPSINFTDENYKALDPKHINHDVKSNAGYETGDILLNVNEQGVVSLGIGESFLLHSMRSWQLTDSETNNYFMEPDFHYTIIGLDGKPSDDVIAVDEKVGSAWADIKAVGKGTAIVLVTYDAIGLNYYYFSDGTKKPFIGGEYWGAIWPENTGAFVVTVGEDENAIKPNMTINEKVNEGLHKNSGKYVDAELDVLYYLDTEEGAHYTFTPEGVDNITIAYPEIGEQMATYSGFVADGVTKNTDGSYTLLLKEGRNIIKLTDSNGNSTYQIMRARPCHRELINVDREGSEIFMPGDKVTVQYSGLFHPANKLAGIYNMSAHAHYSIAPEQIELTTGQSQYKVGSTPAAQAVTIEIPDDYDVTASPQIMLSGGVLQAGGFGDPFGNHRTINPITGRQPNFTAVGQMAHFGYLPDVVIPLTNIKTFEIKIACNVENTDIKVVFKDGELTPGDDGRYTGTAGNYYVTASKAGYRCFHHTFAIEENADHNQTFNIELIKAENIWDGKTVTEPKAENDIYQISTGAELAWLAAHVNVEGKSNIKTNAVLVNDIDLGDYDWTPIGISGIEYAGIFDGQGHTVRGLYIYSTKNMQGLFGYVRGCKISNLEVYGQVTSTGQRVGGIIGYMMDGTIDRCANHADVSGSDLYVGGVTGHMFMPKSVMTNCYNTGTIRGTKSCAGVVGHNQMPTVTIENVFNVGEIYGEEVASCVGGTAAKTKVKNAFATAEYHVTAGQILVTDEQMRSGEVAYKLGEAFGQEIGKDEHPVIGGMKVLYDEKADTYYNDSTSGIEDVTVSETEGAIYYNLQGVASDRPFKGLNIIRLSDGSTHKVFVR